MLPCPKRTLLQTHLEREMEVLHVDVLVGRGLALAPQQETLLGCHFLDGNVLNGESQNDGPDHAQGHLEVAVDNLLGADRHQLHALGRDKVQSFVHVGDLIWGDKSVLFCCWESKGDHLPCGIASCLGLAWAGSRPR